MGGSCCLTPNSSFLQGHQVWVTVEDRWGHQVQRMGYMVPNKLITSQQMQDACKRCDMRLITKVWRLLSWTETRRGDKGYLSPLEHEREVSVTLRVA